MKGGGRMDVGGMEGKDDGGRDDGGGMNNYTTILVSGSKRSQKC